MKKTASHHLHHTGRTVTQFLLQPLISSYLKEEKKKKENTPTSQLELSSPQNQENIQSASVCENVSTIKELSVAAKKRYADVSDHKPQNLSTGNAVFII